MFRFGSRKDVNCEFKCAIRLLDDNEVLQTEFKVCQSVRALVTNRWPTGSDSANTRVSICWTSSAKVLIWSNGITSGWGSSTRISREWVDSTASMATNLTCHSVVELVGPDALYCQASQRSLSSSLSQSVIADCIPHNRSESNRLLLSCQVLCGRPFASQRRDHPLLPLSTTSTRFTSW